jgi:hypothetical protein
MRGDSKNLPTRTSRCSWIIRRSQPQTDMKLLDERTNVALRNTTDWLWGWVAARKSLPCSEIYHRSFNSADSFFIERIIQAHNTVRSESRCALRLRYVDLVVSIEVAV